jgi:hypothetical protein
MIILQTIYNFFFSKKIYFNSLFVEVHKEENHHEVYKDVRFLYQYEQSLKMFYHYQARIRKKKKNH